MTEWREVRVTATLLEELDRQLGSERGPNGEPSATDFLVMDLPESSRNSRPPLRLCLSSLRNSRPHACS